VAKVLNGVEQKNVISIEGSDATDQIRDSILDDATRFSGAKIGGLYDGTVLLTGTSPNTGGTANTTTRIELDSNASSTDGAYDPGCVHITAGTGVGQARHILEYDGTNKYAYVKRDWKVTPDNTSEYAILFSSGNSSVNEGVAQTGSNNTITLNVLASSQNSAYLGQCIFIVSGTGADQTRMVVGYNGTTKVATVDSNWVTNPDNTSIYVMLPFPGFVHGTPTADSAANTLIGDVVGNKTDTTGGTSLVALSKQIVEDTGTTIPGMITTIDGYHDVPSADSVSNTQMRDVIGNKNDSSDHPSIIGRLEYLFALFSETQSVYPSLAEAVEVTVANGEWAALPSPTEIVPASTITNQFIIMGVDVIDAVGAFHLRLYTGSAAAEVELTNIVGVNGSQSFLPCYALVDANERISCSITDSVAGADVYAVKIIYKEI
jgi:hypothetical protein